MSTDPTWLNSPRPGADSPDELPGSLIDRRYLIERKLGQGGVGAVYLARDRKLHERPVVVKVLLEESEQNQWVVQKFLQEKEALARVNHPGVVGIVDTGELPDGKPYIVMQYIEGRSLRDALRQSVDGLDLERVAAIAKQVGSALHAVHSRKIYHRDLKPENIMLQALGRGEEQVKIVDFGIAKIKESVIAPSTVTGTATAGTIVYMSPEQLRGDKVAAASDIYSFGVIAYEMVTGRRPFNPSTVAHLAEMQREGVRVKPTDLRPRLPAAAELVIFRALAFDRRDRYEDAAEFGEALASALLDEPETLEPPASVGVDLAPTLVSVAPTPAPQLSISAEDSPKRWPKIVAALAGLSVVVLVGLAGFLFSSGAKSVLGPAESAEAPVTRERSLVYSLTVQKMRDGKPYQEPFESSGQEIFESGYKFRFNVISPQSGFLYLFNQVPDDRTGRPTFTILYPTPATNQGSARIEPNHSLSTNWNTFAGKADTEEFWMIWSAYPVTELEAARDDAFKDDEGSLTDDTTIGILKQFLAKHSDPKPEITKNTASRQTTVRANGDLLVKLLELEHR